MKSKRLSSILLIMKMIGSMTIGSVGIVLVPLVVSGCDSSASTPAATNAIANARPPKPNANTSANGTPNSTADTAQPFLASSELVVGPERFVFGLVNSKTGKPIKDVPVVGIQFLKVHEDGTATKVSDGTVVYHNENLPAGVFVAQTNFDAAGKWGALIIISRLGQPTYQVPVNFEVVTHGVAPKIGDLAPPSKNVTRKDVKDLNEICSAVPHDDMHDMTIADAVKSGKPTLILFATPGYCETLTCGPDMEVAQAIEKKYSGKANFIHIETPSIPQAPQAQIPTMTEWGLKTEPWIFLVDTTGKITARFEGGITLDEVEPAFVKLIQ